MNFCHKNGLEIFLIYQIESVIYFFWNYKFEYFLFLSQSITILVYAYERGDKFEPSRRSNFADIPALK